MEQVLKQAFLFFSITLFCAPIKANESEYFYASFIQCAIDTGSLAYVNKKLHGERHNTFPFTKDSKTLLNAVQHVNLDVYKKVMNEIDSEIIVLNKEVGAQNLYSWSEIYNDMSKWYYDDTQTKYGKSCAKFVKAIRGGEFESIGIPKVP